MDSCDIKELTVTHVIGRTEKGVCACLLEEDQEITARFKVCNIVRDMLTVQLQQNTACTCCAAELRLAGGKQTSWGARLQDFGPTRSTRTACQSTPCLLRS